jgi:dephospho-CoA kinase
MKRVLVTGMSATGKSSVVQALRAIGHRAVDMDEPGWSEYAPDGEWVWQEDRVRSLVAEDGDVLFVAGCASNQGKFYDRLDEIILLSAPTGLILERLRTRTTNDFGKRPEELGQILRDIAETEPLLRRRATHEIDTSAPLDDVVAEVLRVAGLAA